MRSYGKACAMAQHALWVQTCSSYCQDVPEIKTLEDTYKNGWIDACNEIYWERSND